MHRTVHNANRTVTVEMLHRNRPSEKLYCINACEWLIHFEVITSNRKLSNYLQYVQKSARHHHPFSGNSHRFEEEQRKLTKVKR